MRDHGRGQGEGGSVGPPSIDGTVPTARSGPSTGEWRSRSRERSLWGLPGPGSPFLGFDHYSSSQKFVKTLLPFVPGYPEKTKQKGDSRKERSKIPTDKLAKRWFVAGFCINDLQSKNHLAWSSRFNAPERDANSCYT